MLRAIGFVTVLMALGACLPGGGAVSTGPTTAARADDGEAAKLRPGMSENDAFAVFGPESGFERNPADFDESCLSYAYGPAETPSYVHARFRAGALVQATDGHPGLCTYADPVAAG